MHDNSEHEVAAWVEYAIVDTDNEMTGVTTSEIPGKKCVVLRC